MYDPYKNLVNNLVGLACKIDANDFDPISRIFNGIESAPDEIKYHYQALLDVTSYFQASKGGRGKYIEKKFVSLGETTALNLKLSEVPIWLDNPALYKKKGLKSKANLTNEEKKELQSRCRWTGNYPAYDITTDLGNYIKKEKRLILLEIKNRTDSGGTAARREYWSSKYPLILEMLSDNSKKLFSEKGNQFSLLEFFKKYGIETVSFVNGILFDVEGNPATISGDKNKGFYSENEKQYREFIRRVERTSGFQIVNDDFPDRFLFSMKVVAIPGVTITFGTLYGDDIPQFYLHKRIPLTDILELKFDDIWLALTYAIKERGILLEFKKNFTSLVLDCMHSDEQANELFMDIRETEGSQVSIEKAVQYLLDTYPTTFIHDLAPCKNIEVYLGDLLQLLGCTDGLA
nr:hypothetical protein [Candidatus Sigynarchaeota archaeon]